MNVQPLGVAAYKRVVVLTGAGVSVASGLPTYRGEGGVWRDTLPWVSDGANLPESLHQVWQTFGAMRQRVLEVEPNAAHFALAALQSNANASQTVTLVTQNVDGLHTRAGSQTLELHGSLRRSRCTNRECDSAPFEDSDAHQTAVPTCSRCGSALRPDIVLFNEALPLDASHAAKRALRDCDLFLAVGTSGTVSPASDFARNADYAGARTVFINLEPMTPANPYFQESYLGRAEELLPCLLA